MFDKNSLLFDAAAQTGAVNSAWFDLKAGTPFEGVPFKVLINDATTGSGSNTLAIVVEDSLDGTNVNQTVATFPNLAVGTTGLALGVYEQIKRVATRSRYVRVKVTVSGGGSGLAYTITAGFTAGDIA